MPNGVYPVPKFRFHDNRRTASEPASPWLKVRVLTHRDTLDRWAAHKGPEGLDSYRATKNQDSIDGLPAFTRNA